MPLPGPKISVILQERTDTTGSDMDTTVSWADVVTFQSSFAPLTAREIVEFDKQTTNATHRLMFGADVITTAQAAKLIEKNRFEISSTNYDITGVLHYDASPIGDHYEIAVKLVTT
jgi:hypothetical protein